MIEIRVCPECDKVFYFDSKEGSPPCPHCGHFFNKRRKERVKTMVGFTFYFDGSVRSATIEDYSSDGAMITYIGETLPLDSIVDVNVDELNLRRPARAVWSKKIDRSVAATGLMFL